MLYFGDGGSYSGEFVDGEIRGNGTRSWPDGSSYTGEFVDGEKHGTGASRVWRCAQTQRAHLRLVVVVAL